jgi:hypothetical protein
MIFTVSYKQGLLSPWILVGKFYRYVDVRTAIAAVRADHPQCEYRVEARWEPVPA